MRIPTGVPGGIGNAAVATALTVLGVAAVLAPATPESIDRDHVSQLQHQHSEQPPLTAASQRQ